MLPGAYRLRRERDFQRVYKLGRPVFSNDLNLRFIGNNLEKSRFGFVISHRISSKAVARNRLKRQLGETIRKRTGQIKSGFDAVFTAKKMILHKTFREKEEIVLNLLRKAKLIKNE